MTPIRLTLQAETGAVAIAGLWAYGQLNGSWWLFGALILVPDLLMLGYLTGPRVGAFCYNLSHTYLAPLTLGGAALAMDSQSAQHIALIWIIHIALDRTIGYGLKYGSAFKATHLNRL